MEIILEKYEHIVMDCAVRQGGEFSISSLHGELFEVGQTMLGRAGVQTVLNRLVKKKLLKKRYVRVKFLKFQPLYLPCVNREFYLGPHRSPRPVQ